MLPWRIRAAAWLVLTSTSGPAAFQQSPSAAPAPSDVLRIQVLLDRAAFSPGEIDGRWGRHTAKALEAYGRSRGLTDAASWTEALLKDTAPTVVRYTVTAEDVAGPFVKTIPADLEAQARLPALGYRTIREALAERFHCAESVLDHLNAASRYAVGDALVVPNVGSSPGDAPGGADVDVTVSRGEGVLTVRRGDDVVFHAPATTGSTHDPLPLGDWTVTAVVRNPTFHYNPDLFWDASPADEHATLPPGPNAPVGVVWIDLSRPHYGIHGTPEPKAIGHTASHGCVRLTNWDARRVAALVAKGTPVHFVR